MVKDVFHRNMTQPEQDGAFEGQEHKDSSNNFSLLNRAFEGIRTPEQLEFLNDADNPEMDDVRSAFDNILDAATTDLAGSGSLLRGLTNPVARLAIFDDALLLLFKEDDLLQRVMTDAGFLPQDIERARERLAKHERWRQARDCAQEWLDGGSEHAFGYQELRAINTWKLALLEPSVSDTMRNVLSVRLDEARRELSDKVQRSAQLFFSSMYQRDAASAQKLTEVAIQHGFDASRHSPNGQEFLDALAEEFTDQGRFPAELLEELVEKHIALVRSMNIVFREQLAPKYLLEFKQALRGLISENSLPITVEQAERILDGVTFRVDDDVDDALARIRAGSYSHKQVSVTPNSFESGGDHLKHTVFHELVHAISAAGRRGHGMPRVGLRFREWFGWLNEAKTEEITLRLLGFAAFDAYGDERKELETLYAQGLSRELVDHAYFDDLDPDLPKKESLAGWRAMIKSLNKICPEGGARRLRAIQAKLEDR